MLAFFFVEICVSKLQKLSGAAEQQDKPTVQILRPQIAWRRTDSQLCANLGFHNVDVHSHFGEDLLVCNFHWRSEHLRDCANRFFFLAILRRVGGPLTQGCVPIASLLKQMSTVLCYTETKYSLENIFETLQDGHTFAPFWNPKWKKAWKNRSDFKILRFWRLFRSGTLVAATRPRMRRAPPPLETRRTRALPRCAHSPLQGIPSTIFVQGMRRSVLRQPRQSGSHKDPKKRGNRQTNRFRDSRLRHKLLIFTAQLMIAGLKHMAQGWTRYSTASYLKSCHRCFLTTRTESRGCLRKGSSM